jgi:hypothetical protein
MWPNGNQGGQPMLSRRNLLLAGSAAGLCAPAIVRAHILMPIRGIVLSEDIPHYGFVQRLMAHSYMQSIEPRLLRGLSAYAIAAELNRRNSRAINGSAWNAEGVTNIIKLDQAIRDADRRQKSARLLGS